MTDQKKLEEIAKTVEEVKPPEKDTDQSGVYFFVSFDLANSTAFKRVSKTWPSAVTKFYELTASETRTHRLGKRQLTLWKYLGDEVLLFRKLQFQNDLEVLIPRIFEATKKIAKGLAHSFANEFKACGICLSVKSSCWIAKIQPLNSSDIREEIDPALENVIFSTSEGQLDFIGPDIDVGFRIGKYAYPGILTLSTELAYLLTKTTTDEVQDKFRVVGYSVLKGVWRGRHYPAVWWAKEWSRSGENIFRRYDDRLKSEFVNFVLSKEGETGDKAKIKQALKDNDFLSVVSSLAEDVKRLPVPTEADVEATIKNDFADGRLNIHLVAICFDEAGRFLVLKRSESKEILPGKWEFGCCQAEPGVFTIDHLKDSYLSKYKLHIKIYTHPIRRYEVLDSNSEGFIFIGKAINPSDVNFNEGKYSEHRWLSGREAEEFDFGECVPDFHDSMSAAIERFEKVKGGNGWR